MSSVKNHLSDFHECAKAVHLEHAKLAKAAGEHRAHDFHKSMADLHQRKCEECSGGGTEKAAAGDEGKVAVQTVDLALVEEFRQGLHKLSQFAEQFGNRIMPDNIRGVIPSNPLHQPSQAVVRPGQPELVNRKDIPIEFSEILKVE